MDIGKRIKEIRLKKGISQNSLAKKAGISQSGLSAIESGESSPSFSVLSLIAKALNLDPSGLMMDTDGASSNSPWNENGIDIAPRKKGIKIPVLGRVAAGIPVEAVQDVIDYEEIDEEMAKTGEFFALQIKGDSMEPRIKSGDVVIVRKQDVVDSGEIAIVMVNGDDATCKKFVKHKNGVSLVSMNPAYTPMFYTMDEVESLPVRVLGRVMELRAKF